MQNSLKVWLWKSAGLNPHLYGHSGGLEFSGERSYPSSVSECGVSSRRRLIHNLQAAVPGRLTSSAKRVVRAWGRLTATGRMLPDFIVVGAQRSGTTTLFRLLSAHPQVLRPTISKSVAYFDLNYERGFRWYRSHFPLQLTARLRGSGRKVVTFESSGYYMYHPLAPYRIAEDLPEVRVIVMLRDPVDRAHSAHQHEVRRGFETLPFAEAIRREAERLQGEVERLRSEPSYHSIEHQHHSYLGRSQYGPQLTTLIDAVGPERIFVVDADRFFLDLKEEFSRLCVWLGLDAPTTVEERVWNAAPREPLDPEIRKQLQRRFTESNVELSVRLAELPAWGSQNPISWARIETTRSDERPSSNVQ